METTASKDILQRSSRWLALDAAKTITVLGTLLAHIFIWWFGENFGTGARLYHIDLSQSVTFAYFSFIVLLITSSGAAFYFYIDRKELTMKQILKRSSILVIIGLFFAVNTQPFLFLWNIFFFYAVSLILITLIYKRYGIKGIVLSSAASYLGLLILRLVLDQTLAHNYFIEVLIGDPIRSQFPILPWIFMLGVGFSVAHLFHHMKAAAKKKMQTLWILIFGALIAIIVSRFLTPINESDIFGITAQMPAMYLVYFAGLFICMISLLDLVLANGTLEKYNPINTIGRHTLAVYLITLLTMLGVVNHIEETSSLQMTHPIGTFLWLNIATILLAYTASYFLEKRRK